MKISRLSLPSPWIPLVLLLSILFLCAAPLQAAEEPGRFFLMGSGKMHLKNLRNSREARVELLNPDGSLNETALTEADRVFGFPAENGDDHISPRLLFMVSYFADRMAPGKTVNIESAYRSPEYNDKIRKKGANAARTSTHMDGMALDFWLAGVNGKKLWQTIRQEDCCGVGHYGGKTVHLDAGRPRFWEAATSGTKNPEPDYNRHVYLSTDFDRYRPGASLRLSLSGISTFGFGVRPVAVLESPGEKAKTPIAIEVLSATSTGCIILEDRKTARFLAAVLPTDLPAGRYRIGLSFCSLPFPQMPQEVQSNEIEVMPAQPR